MGNLALLLHEFFMVRTIGYVALAALEAEEKDIS